MLRNPGGGGNYFYASYEGMISTGFSYDSKTSQTGGVSAILCVGTIAASTRNRAMVCS